MGDNMDKQDRKEIEELKNEVKGLSFNFNGLSKIVKDIKENHLKHLNLKINITLAGLAFIAIMIAILGCMIAWGVGMG